MKKLSCIFLLSLISGITFGQELFNKHFVKPDMDFADAVIERKDGKYLIVGSSNSRASTDYDINLLLVDSLGNLVWDKYLTEVGTYEFAYSIIASEDDNYLITGSNNTNHSIMLKVDTAGNMLWQKEYYLSESGKGISLGANPDGSYQFLSTNVDHYFSPHPSRLIKVTANGDTIWTKFYINTSCFAVTATSDSGYALTGSVNNSSEGRDRDVLLLKTDINGDTTWTKTYGGIGSDFGTTLLQTKDEGYLIAGSFDPQIVDAGHQTYLIRTNSQGDTIWTVRDFKGTPKYIQECKKSAGFILSTTNYFQSFNPQIPDLYYITLVKLDTLGNIQWSRTFDGYTYHLGNNITETSDGGFLLTGHNANRNSQTNAVLIKLDSAGAYVLDVSLNKKINRSVLKVFPNPASNELNLDFADVNEEISNIEIFNTLGQKVISCSIGTRKALKIDILQLKEGIYLYKAYSKDKRIYNGKFLVKK